MPLYTFRNKETGETKDMVISVSSMQKLTEEGVWEQVIGAPNMVTHTGNIVNKTSGDWKDHLKKIKKSSGKQVANSINL
jgi:hypothetical protein